MAKPMTNQEIEDLGRQSDEEYRAAQAAGVVGQVTPGADKALRKKGVGSHDLAKNATAAMSTLRDASVSARLEQNVAPLAQGFSTVAAPTSFTAQDLAHRNAGRSRQADAALSGYFGAQRASLAGGQQQADLNNLLRVRAMGGGPSVAAIQGQAAQDNIARSMAGAGQGLLAQRQMQLNAAPAAVNAAAQFAGQRMGEQGQAQGVYGGNLAAMRGQSLQGMGIATQHGLAQLALNDQAVFGNAGLEQQAALATHQSDEAMRQRQLREWLRQAGDKEAKNSQQMARTGGLISASAGVANDAGNAILGAIGAKKGLDK